MNAFSIFEFFFYYEAEKDRQYVTNYRLILEMERSIMRRSVFSNHLPSHKSETSSSGKERRRGKKYRKNEWHPSINVTIYSINADKHTGRSRGREEPREGGATGGRSHGREEPSRTAVGSVSRIIKSTFLRQSG